MPFGMWVRIWKCFLFWAWPVWLAAFCPYVLCPDTVAQESPSLTLPEALQLSIARNAGYLAGQQDIDIAGADIVTAKTRSNPLFLADMGIAEATYRFGFINSLELASKRQSRIALARAKQNEAFARHEAQRIQIQARVRQHYGQLYVLQQQLQRLQPFFPSTGQTTESLIHTRQETLPQQQLTFFRLENAYDNVQSLLLMHQYQLNALLGFPMSQQHRLAPPELGSLPETLEAAVQIALTNHPEIAQKQAREQSTLHGLRLERSNRIPDINYSVGMDMLVPPAVERNTFGVFVITTLPIPVFNQNRGTIQKGVAARKKALLETDAMETEIARQVAEDYTQVLNNQRIVQRYETKILPLAGAAPPVSSTTNPPTEWISLQLEYLQALLAYHQALAELDSSLGMSGF